MRKDSPTPIRGLVMLGVALVVSAGAIGWFFRAEYYLTALKGGDYAAEAALVDLGPAARGAIYRQLNDGSATPEYRAALARCAVKSYLAAPSDDQGELVAALAQAMSDAQAGAPRLELLGAARGLDSPTFVELACRTRPLFDAAEFTRIELAARERQVNVRCTP